MRQLQRRTETKSGSVYPCRGDVSPAGFDRRSAFYRNDQSSGPAGHNVGSIDLTACILGVVDELRIVAVYRVGDPRRKKRK